MPYDPESYVHRIGRTGRAGRDGKALLLVTPRERRMLSVVERVIGQKIDQVQLPDAAAVLQARITNLKADLLPRMQTPAGQVKSLLERLTASLDCHAEDLALALLGKLTEGMAFDTSGIEREYPVQEVTARPERNRSFERGERGERGNRERRENRSTPLLDQQNRVRCRTALGTRDGIAARNLLGAILNEGGLGRDAIGRIQIRETFSLVELPEAGLDSLLGKLKDTRVGGKPLKLRRYRE